MPNKGSEEYVVNVDAYEPDEMDVDRRIFMHINDDYLITSLATNAFVLEKEANVVKMVKKSMDKSKEDDKFLDDNEVEVFKDEVKKMRSLLMSH